MLSNLSIGKRMGIAFATLVCLALALAASGYWGLANVTATAEMILTVDVAAAETSGEVQAATLNLRRYEKDYFLNIAEAPVEAFSPFNTMFQALPPSVVLYRPRSVESLQSAPGTAA